MFFYRILSFLLCINSYNSFFTGIIYRKPINFLKMGCDYYIEKNLYIYYKDNSIGYINIKKNRGYFYEIHRDMTIDLSLYNSSVEARNRLKEYHLEPKEMPCLIYSHGNFTNKDLSKKYKMILEYEMMNHDYKTWDDINHIVVIEERYKRD